MSKQKKLNPYIAVIAFVIIIACGFIAFMYARQAYASFTERPGLYGNLHTHYRISRKLFGLYHLLISAAAAVVILLQLASLIRSDLALFKKACRIGAAMFIVMLLMEYYLYTQFTGKG